MAEKAVVAFGRYLKLLRERRKLSLDDVVSLTKAYPEPINKGYLSRAERGLSHIAFSKIVALGRAYEVPVDVFGEKLSLDLEVEQLKDPPVTEGKTFPELLSDGTRLGKLGLRLQAYAVLREVQLRAGGEPVASNYSSLGEQVAATALSLGIAAGWLGRLRLSRHEVDYAVSLKALGPEYLPTASIQLSVLSRKLANFELARRHADEAISLASGSPARRFLGDALASRGLLATYEGKHEEAIHFYTRSFRFFRDEAREPEAARTMANLASTYFSAGRIRAARRAIGVAARIAKKCGALGVVSRTKILLGEIEAAGGRRDLATRFWLNALDDAKKCDDRLVAFKAEFQLFRSALETGNVNGARAFGRRLNKLWPWVPYDEPDVQEFRALWLEHAPKKQRRVAARQHEGRS